MDDMQQTHTELARLQDELRDLLRNREHWTPEGKSRATELEERIAPLRGAAADDFEARHGIHRT